MWTQVGSFVGDDINSIVILGNTPILTIRVLLYTRDTQTGV
jgi:hypothetical protein